MADTYSLTWAWRRWRVDPGRALVDVGDRAAADIELWVAARIALAPRAPVVDLWCGRYPRVADPAPGAPDLAEAAAAGVIGLSPRDGPGQPSRRAPHNLATAIQCADMSDVLGRALAGVDDSVAAYLADVLSRYAAERQAGGLAAAIEAAAPGETPRLAPEGRAVTFQRRPGGAERCKAAERWRATGREALAANGAWPWAVADRGRLGPRWWRDPAYAAALDAWAALSRDS